jgi:hypothetical protein
MTTSPLKREKEEKYRHAAKIFPVLMDRPIVTFILIAKE